jgi:hypothetical protein
MNAIVSSPTAVGSSIINTNTASTSGVYTLAVGSVGRSRVASPPSQKNIESAIYAHIQAVRALGRTRIDTAEIAKALDLTPFQVERTISSLTRKGVKLVNG